MENKSYIEKIALSLIGAIAKLGDTHAGSIENAFYTEFIKNGIQELREQGFDVENVQDIENLIDAALL